MSTNISELPFNTKTELPSRDIPRETLEHVADPQVSATYVPPKPPPYIPNSENKFEKLIEEFRIPIIVAILYFIFETPTLQALFTRVLPTFKETPLLKSVCFGGLYYLALMGMEYMNH
jgi:hypothetical protein